MLHWSQQWVNSQRKELALFNLISLANYDPQVSFPTIIFYHPRIASGITLDLIHKSRLSPTFVRPPNYPTLLPTSESNRDFLSLSCMVKIGGPGQYRQAPSSNRVFGICGDQSGRMVSVILGPTPNNPISSGALYSGLACLYSICHREIIQVKESLSIHTSKHWLTWYFQKIAL